MNDFNILIFWPCAETQLPTFVFVNEFNLNTSLKKKIKKNENV